MMEATAQDKKCAHLCFKETKKGGKSKGRPQTFQEKKTFFLRLQIYFNANNFIGSSVHQYGERSRDEADSRGFK